MINRNLRGVPMWNISTGSNLYEDLGWDDDAIKTELKNRIYTIRDSNDVPTVKDALEVFVFEISTVIVYTTDLPREQRPSAPDVVRDAVVNDWDFLVDVIYRNSGLLMESLDDSF